MDVLRRILHFFTESSEFVGSELRSINSDEIVRKFVHADDVLLDDVLHFFVCDLNKIFCLQPFCEVVSHHE